MPVDDLFRGARFHIDAVMRMNGEYFAIYFHRRNTGQNVKERVRMRRVMPFFNIRLVGGHALLNDAQSLRPIRSRSLQPSPDT